MLKVIRFSIFSLADLILIKYLQHYLSYLYEKFLNEIVESFVQLTDFFQKLQAYKILKMLGQPFCKNSAARNVRS